MYLPQDVDIHMEKVFLLGRKGVGSLGAWAPINISSGITTGL